MSFYTPTKWTKYLRNTHYQSIGEMVFDTIKNHPSKMVMRWFGKDGTSVKSLTYKELADYINVNFHALYSLGYKKGDHISICAATSPKWAWADLGVQCLGCATIAIYPQLKPKEILYIAKDSESVGLFIDTQENLEKFYAIQDDLPNIRYVVVFEEFDNSLKKSNVLSWDEFLEKGVSHQENHPNLLKESLETIKEDDLASLIYTSGTTGVPKGVMLTHKNFLSDVLVVSAIAITLEKGEKPWDAQSLTYMPFAHSYARTAEEYAMIFNTGCINFVGGRTQAQLQKSFRVYKPSIFVGVPYLYQKLYERVIDTVATMSEGRQKIFNKAYSLGKQYYTNILNKKKNPLGLKLKYALLKKLVFGRIKKELGGNLQLMVTASAAISEELLLFFWSCGFNIAEGYGLSEAAPATHYSRTIHNSDFRPNFNKKIDIYEKIGTVGPLLEIPEHLNPYENMQQKLGPDGELLIKGPNIMKGYWKKPKLTEAAIDKDGWFHTGDLSEIDDDGYVKIIGRSKAIIKLSTGKMISPALVEGLIVPYSRKIAQIVFVGQEKKYLTAIIVPYQEPFKKYADEKGIKYEKWEDIVRNKEIQRLMKEEILSFTEEISEFSRPKRFAIACRYFSEDEGFLTPTLKFKRNKVYKDLAHIIDKLYEVDDEFLIIEERLSDFYDMSILT
jgi:long-chain acyl-CoA synthetase